MSGYRVDWSKWPVLIMTPPAYQMSDAEMRACMDEIYAELCKRSGAYVMVNDLRVSPGTTPKQRQMLVDEMARTEALKNVTQLGIGMVFSSVIMRGMLTAVFWMKKPKWETRVFATVDEAVEWSRGLIEQYQKRPSLGMAAR